MQTAIVQNRKYDKHILLRTKTTTKISKHMKHILKILNKHAIYTTQILNILRITHMLKHTLRIIQIQQHTKQKKT